MRVPTHRLVKQRRSLFAAASSFLQRRGGGGGGDGSAVPITAGTDSLVLLPRGEGRKEGFSSGVTRDSSCGCSRPLSRICEDGRPPRRSGTLQCHPIACPGSWEIRRPTTLSITSFPAPRSRFKPSLSSKRSLPFFRWSRMRDIRWGFYFSSRSRFLREILLELGKI